MNLLDRLPALPRESPGTPAYWGVRGDKVVVVGELKLGEFDNVWDIRFSADGKKVAFGARIGRQLWWKVADVK